MTESERYTYHDGLATLTAWSDRSVQTSGAISEWIAQTAEASPVNLLDVGTGDGELLATALEPLLNRVDVGTIELVEPDAELREAAVERLRGLGLSYDSIRTRNGMKDTVCEAYSHVLAAHVLYYLLPAEDSLASIRRVLADPGRLCIVIRSDLCDTYRMRQVVRSLDGTAASLSLQSVTEALQKVGFADVSIKSVNATLQTPEGVSVLAEGSETITTDESFDYLIRWMTRLPESRSIDPPVREALRRFVERRAGTSGLTLHLEDRVITASSTSVLGHVVN